MRRIHTFTGIGTVLSTLALLGCSSIDSPIAAITWPKKPADSTAASLGKSKNDDVGRPVPGSQAPPAVAEQSSPPSNESRAHVELAMGEMLEEAGKVHALELVTLADDGITLSPL